MNTRTPVYCPSCDEYWWSLDDGIVGMTCGLGTEEGVVRRATPEEIPSPKDEVLSARAKLDGQVNGFYARDWSGLT